MRPLYTLLIPQSVVLALNKAGYNNCEELFEGDIEYQKKAIDILKTFNLNFGNIKSLMLGRGSVSAAQLLRNEQMSDFIPTFSESVDNILGGGVEVGSLLQICGPPGSGKTQFVMQLCVNVQMPCSLGGLESESVFIDSEMTFSANRLREIAVGACSHCSEVAKMHNMKETMNNFSSNTILTGIHYIGIGSIQQFLAAIHQLRILTENNKKIKCIAIDSFTFPFLTISNHLERTRYISITIQKLHELAVKRNVAVIFTNHLTTKINHDSKFLVPSLGESLSHITPNILLLGKSGNLNSAVMYKSFKFPEEVVLFKINSEGIRDVE